MRIAIFGGSFDPVHTEHIRLVEAAIQTLALDRLFVVPALTPPHKSGKLLSSNAARLKMCALAFDGMEKVFISDYEIARGGTSYTYLTCQHFRSLYPTAEIFWLVGTDMLRDFPTWKNTREILNNVTLAVCGRNENAGWETEEQRSFFDRFQKQFAVVRYNGQDVSSTQIRVRAAAGENLDCLPASVADFIKKEGLYKIDGAREALALETEKRKQHSFRVAELAAKRALSLKISESKAIAAALFHDCAKNLEENSPYLQGFVLPTEWGAVPQEVTHQFSGAYVAEKFFGVTDEDVLQAIRYHTSARPNMSELEKLIFLADMLEEARNYDGVEELRRLFWQGDSLDACLKEALYQTLLFLKNKKSEIYPLTQAAYEYALRAERGEV